MSGKSRKTNGNCITKLDTLTVHVLSTASENKEPLEASLEHPSCVAKQKRKQKMNVSVVAPICAGV